MTDQSKEQEIRDALKEWEVDGYLPGLRVFSMDYPIAVRMADNSPQWLQYLLTEVESLRSQLDEINSHGREGRIHTNAEYESQRSRAQQAEQERAEDCRKIVALWKEIDIRDEAITAMREALQWYADKKTYAWFAVDGDEDGMPYCDVLVDEGARAREALSIFSRYTEGTGELPDDPIQLQALIDHHAAARLKAYNKLLQVEGANLTAKLGSPRPPSLRD